MCLYLAGLLLLLLYIFVCTSFFFFNDTATTEIYTLSLHDALPISHSLDRSFSNDAQSVLNILKMKVKGVLRSEEHTSELQSLTNLVCRLLLEKKKKRISNV